MIRPRGLGLWVAFPGAVEGGDWGKMAARLQENGVGWLAVRSGGTHRAISPAELQRWIKLAEGAGAACFTWHYSYPADLAIQVQHIESLKSEGIAGHVIDAEAEWQARIAKLDTAHMAEAFGNMLRTELGPDFYLSHAPLGIEDLHADFPYFAFDHFCDEVHPQAYWTEFGWPLAATMNRVDQDYLTLQKQAPDTPVVSPVGVTYGKGSKFGHAPGVLTADDVARFLARYGSNGRTCSMYSWENAQPAFWQGLASFRSIAPPSPLAPPMVSTRDVQGALAAIAHAIGRPDLDPGPADNLWGPHTQRALEAFERLEGLAVGPLSPTVREALVKVFLAVVPR